MEGLGTVGFGHDKSADRLDVQNGCIRSYRYHCLCTSKLFGMISVGNSLEGMGCRRMLHSSLGAVVDF